MRRRLILGLGVAFLMPVSAVRAELLTKAAEPPPDPPSEVRNRQLTGRELDGAIEHVVEGGREAQKARRTALTPPRRRVAGPQSPVYYASFPTF